MFQTQLISSVLVWERILEIEEEKQKMNYFEDVFTNDLASLKSGQKKRKNLFARFSWISKRPQTTYNCCAQEPCQETQSR